ncbi:MAG: hypothetical protein L0154_12640 [Chloroflexi bacterium]|nr:hypothetical protein [Chloroflexota bacterium]
MLGQAEQQVFMKLSVFRGGFTREAAVEVAGANLRTLMNLMNNSLLQRNPDTGRFTIHELLRQYIAQHLDASGEKDAASDAHAAYYAELLAQQVPYLKGKGQVQAVNAIETEYSNCRTAWDWAVAQRHDNLVDKMIDSLYLYLTLQSWLEGGVELFQRAREQWPVSRTNAPSIAGRVGLRFPPTFDPHQRIEIMERSLAIAQQSGNMPEIAFCQRELGLQIGHHTSNEPDVIRRGLAILEDSLQSFRRIGDRFYEARVLDDIGWCYTRLREVRTRERYSQQSIALRQEVGDVLGLSDAIAGYVMSTAQYHPEKALERLKDAYEVARQANDRLTMASTTAMRAALFITRGELENANVSIEQSFELAYDINHDTLLTLNLLAKAIIICVRDQDYDKCIELIRTALPTDEKMESTFEFKINGFIAYCLYFGSVANYEQLEFHLRRVWDLVFMNDAHFMMLIIPMYAMVLAAKGQKIRAVEYLELCFTHADNRSHLIHKWQVLSDFRESLKAELGEVLYAAATERGKNLKLDDVFGVLQAEFGENEA